MAIENLGEFNRWIARQTREVIPEQALLFQKRIALEVFRRIVLKSPVGNPSLWANPGSAPPGYVGGRFRANWQIDVSLNTSQRDSTDIPVPNPAAIAAAKPFGTIWIFNNVPYAQRLETGWSSQAPSGVVAVTLAEIVAGGIR